MFKISRFPVAALPLLLVSFSLVACSGPAADLVASDALTRSSSDRRADSSASSEPVEPSSASESVAKDAVLVRTVKLEPQRLDDIVRVTGELRANEEVELRAEEDGRVVALHFDEGQRVAAGELLVKINDADLQAELRRAQVQRAMAERREQRMEKLLAEQTVSQEVYDEARGRLSVLEAEIELIEARIAKTEVHAPFAGVLGLRTVSQGSHLTSAQVVATLQSLDPIKIDFAVPEKYASALGAGAEVELEVAGQAETVTGRVYAVEPRIDAATRTVQVRAKAPNPDRRLLPGAFAEVRLVLERIDDALLVPSIALIPGLEATTVYVVEDGAAQPRQVQVGRRTAEQVQILDGLAAGDEVIVSGLQQLKPGVAVAVR